MTREIFAETVLTVFVGVFLSVVWMQVRQTRLKKRITSFYERKLAEQCCLKYVLEVPDVPSSVSVVMSHSVQRDERGFPLSFVFTSLVLAEYDMLLVSPHSTEPVTMPKGTYTVSLEIGQDLKATYRGRPQFEAPVEVNRYGHVFVRLPRDGWDILRDPRRLGVVSS